VQPRLRHVQQPLQLRRARRRLHRHGRQLSPPQQHRLVRGSSRREERASRGLPRSNTGSYPICNTSADAHIYANRLSCSYASNHSQPRTHPSGDTDTVGAVDRETRHSIRADRRASVTSASSAVFYWYEKGYV
jgi:hypothetical protein